MSTTLATAIWGASGHALVVAEILRLIGGHEVVGYIDDLEPERRGSAHGALPILGGRECLSRGGFDAVALGFGACAPRLSVAEFLESRGLRLVTAVHPRAVVSPDASLGAGTVVAAGALINPFARVGKAAIINTGASVDHECELEDGVHLSPGAHLAGRVRVGRATWIGIGACVIDGVHIGANVIVGAGAVVTRDLPDGIVAYGVPARVQRTMKADG